MENLILNQSSKFGRHSTVIAITPSINTQWVTELQSLNNRGVQVTAITLTSDSFDELTSPNNIYKTLEQNGILYYAIVTGADLAITLSSKISHKIKLTTGDEL